MLLPLRRVNVHIFGFLNKCAVFFVTCTNSFRWTTVASLLVMAKIVQRGVSVENRAHSFQNFLYFNCWMRKCSWSWSYVWSATTWRLYFCSGWPRLTSRLFTLSLQRFLLTRRTHNIDNSTTNWCSCCCIWMAWFVKHRRLISSNSIIVVVICSARLIIVVWLWLSCRSWTFWIHIVILTFYWICALSLKLCLANCAMYKGSRILR